MRQQPIDNKKKKKSVQIINNKSQSLSNTASASSAPPDPADFKPIRTVHFVEVGNMSPNQIQMLFKEVAANFSRSALDLHYLIPVRNGNLPSDIYFEKEILEMVNKLCEVVDGKIALKNGASEVRIFREFV